MEILTFTISTIFLLGFIIIPALLFIKIKRRRLLRGSLFMYLTFGLGITTLLMFAFAWWGDYSDQFLMRQHGYEFEGLTVKDRFQNVPHHQLERVKQLEIGYYGIGWPVKAIIMFAFYTPYLFIVYFMGQILFSFQKNKTSRLSPTINEHIEIPSHNSRHSGY